MIVYFVFQYGCLATRRGEKKNQRRTRAAQQPELSGGCAPQKKSRCSSADLAIRNRLGNSNQLARLPACLYADCQLEASRLSPTLLTALQPLDNLVVNAVEARCLSVSFAPPWQTMNRKLRSCWDQDRTSQLTFVKVPVAKADVRVGTHNGLKSDIAPCLLRARKRHALDGMACPKIPLDIEYRNATGPDREIVFATGGAQPH